MIPIIAAPSFLCKWSLAMSENGYIRIPRSLFTDPLWRSLTFHQQHIFLVILNEIRYESEEFNDHGLIFKIEAGQVCTTYRKIAQLCEDTTHHQVHRSIEKFILIGFLRQEVRHTKSVLSICHKGILELILNNGATEIATGLRQDCDIKEERKKERRERYMSDSDEFGLSTFLFESIKKFNPAFKDPNLQNWSRQFDLLIRVDKRPIEEVKKYIIWSTSDGCWWQGKILSPDKLRKHWDTLTSQMKNDKKDISETNRDFAHRLSQAFFSSGFEVKIDISEVVLIPLQGEQKPFALKYSEAGFKDQLKNIFIKRGFKKKEIQNGQQI